MISVSVYDGKINNSIINQVKNKTYIIKNHSIGKQIKNNFNAKFIQLQKILNSIIDFNSFKKNTKIKSIYELPKISNKENMQKIVQGILYGEKILEIGEYKNNLLILNSLLKNTTEEIKSYQICINSDRDYYNKFRYNENPKTSIEDIKVETYSELKKIIKNERRRTFFNIIKLKLGIKPSTAQEWNAIYNHDEFIKKIQKEKLDKIELEKLKEEEFFWNNSLDYSI